MANLPIFFVFTGGGSGGHATVSICILEAFKKKFDFSLSSFLYIGGDENSLEFKKAQKLNVPYEKIKTGKLVRKIFYPHFKEFIFFLSGFFSSLKYILKASRKTYLVVFSSGGFVSVPVVLASFFSKFLGRKVSIYLHEQTTRAGLANRLCSHFVDHIFISFEKSSPFFKKEKTSFSGYPLREEFYLPHIPPFFKGIDLSTFDKPVLFFSGGGNGSKLINSLVASLLESEKDRYVVFHQTGAKFIDHFSKYKNPSYFPFDFDLDLPNLLKRASLVVTRSGAGICSEILHLRKKAIFIPLKIAQKNEQFYNALEVIQTLGFGKILEEKTSLEKGLLSKEISALLGLNLSNLSQPKTPLTKPSDFIVDFIASRSPFFSNK